MFTTDLRRSVFRMNCFWVRDVLFRNVKRSGSHVQSADVTHYWVLHSNKFEVEFRVKLVQLN